MTTLTIIEILFMHKLNLLDNCSTNIVSKTTALSFCKYSVSLSRLDVHLKCSTLIRIKLYLAKFWAPLSPSNTPKGITLLCQDTLWSTVCMGVELQYTVSPWQAPQVKRTLLSPKLILTLTSFTYSHMLDEKRAERKLSHLTVAFLTHKVCFLDPTHYYR